MLLVLEWKDMKVEYIVISFVIFVTVSDLNLVNLFKESDWVDKDRPLKSVVQQ